MNLINQIVNSKQYQDLREGDLYEYLLSLQEEFAGVVARVKSLRGRMSEAGR